MLKEGFRYCLWNQNKYASHTETIFNPKPKTMAELDQSSAANKKRPGVRRSKKLSTRVDLTPMVDLGFLLITFFIFTTSLSRPTTLAMKLPKDVPDNIKQKQPASGALTVLLAGNDRVFYYERDDLRTMQLISPAGIQTVILAKKIKTNASDFMVIMKHRPGSIIQKCYSDTGRNEYQCCKKICTG